MLNLDDEMTQTMDAMTPRRENPSLNTARAAATGRTELVRAFLRGTIRASYRPRPSLRSTRRRTTSASSGKSSSSLSSFRV
jgi:hypothetical protein